jgi:NADPH-dependent 2,4-dienoyl-CoA reductase/sulfur reductase-like enzyme
MPERSYVIVGGGLAGAKAAQTLREHGFPGRIVLAARERERPYERPPLSKDYLLGRAELEAARVHDTGWYADHDVDLRLGATAISIDRTRHEVGFDDGDQLPYDKLLLTTGASVRRLEVPGAESPAVHYLRTTADAERLRAALSPGGRRVVIVGAGWIGLEVTAAAREHGNDVTVVEPGPTPLYRSVGRELGEVFAGLHQRHGVEFRFGQEVVAIRGAGAVAATPGPGAEVTVVTSDGTRLPADVVVVGIGVRPNVALARSARLEVDDGIVVDASLRTPDPDVYAAGDVANAHSPLYGKHIRVEHWANALHGGPAAARSMLGEDVVYDPVPYFYSDQYELGMEATGVITPGDYDELIYRGDVATLEFVAFWITGGRVVAGMNVNVWDVVDDIQALIRSGCPVDRSRLADPAVPLSELL